MSKSQTPETDAETMQDEYDHVDSEYGPFAPSDTVPAEFARKLEIERDEAREMLEKSKRARKSHSDACDHLGARLAHLSDIIVAERDLADELAYELSCLANWRQFHAINSYYDPSPLAKWKEARKS